MDQVFKLQAELEAGAAARAHFWFGEEQAVTIQREPASIARNQPRRRLTIVIRTQVLRAVEPPIPDDLEERRLNTEQMVRYWWAASLTSPYVQHPARARGTMRSLRPPSTEEEPIRAPPHRPEGSYTDANSAEEKHAYSSSVAVALAVAVAVACTTSKERNKFHTAKACYCLRHREFSLTGCVLLYLKNSLQKTNSCLSVSRASFIKIGDPWISCWDYDYEAEAAIRSRDYFEKAQSAALSLVREQARYCTCKPT